MGLWMRAAPRNQSEHIFQKSKLHQVELGFSSLTSRASSLWRPETSRVFSVVVVSVPKKSFYYVLHIMIVTA